MLFLRMLNYSLYVHFYFAYIMSLFYSYNICADMMQNSESRTAESVSILQIQCVLLAQIKLLKHSQRNKEMIHKMK